MVPQNTRCCRTASMSQRSQPQQVGAVSSWGAAVHSAKGRQSAQCCLLAWLMPKAYPQKARQHLE